MADQAFNIALGQSVGYFERVRLNDPANAALVIVAINSTNTDAERKDVDTLTALLALGNTAEVTNTNYARKVLTDADLSAPTVDDGNDRIDLDIPDQTWSAIAAGDAWTHLIVCYDPDSTGGTDADLVPISQHDFAITPDGSDIIANVAAAGFIRAD